MTDEFDLHERDNAPFEYSAEFPLKVFSANGNLVFMDNNGVEIVSFFLTDWGDVESGGKTISADDANAKGVL